MVSLMFRAMERVLMKPKCANKVSATKLVFFLKVFVYLPSFVNVNAGGEDAISQACILVRE